MSLAVHKALREAMNLGPVTFGIRAFLTTELFPMTASLTFHLANTLHIAPVYLKQELNAY